VAIIAVAICGGQELLARWLFPLPEVDGFNRINYTHVHLFGAEVAAAQRVGLSNVRLRWESAPDGFAFEHTLNLYGFRGPDFRVDPPAGRPRALFVGDSYVEGCGAADDATLPAQFAAAVQDAEAINLGVAAANFPEYARLVRDGVSLLRPAAVFLVLSANDLPAPPLPPAVLRQVPSFPRENPWVPRLVEMIRRAADGRSVPRRFLGGRVPFMVPVPSPANRLTRYGPPGNIDPEILKAMERGKANSWNAAAAGHYAMALGWDFTQRGGVRDQLRDLQALCSRAGARLVVVYVPYPGSVSVDYVVAQNRLGGPPLDPSRPLDDPAHRRQQEHLREATRALGLPFLDTTDAFIAAERAGERMFWPIDGHCNARGYHLLATIAAKYWRTGTAD
jgi:lysophospholipase L1-like esterase